MIGTRLGPYEITAKLGEGGMGEVYQAKDFHLGRNVALKVLPEGFTQDAERLARFEREAKLLAQLNHPNIAQIYGLEVSGETRALVMELVEGPTLAELLEQGPLPFNESLSVSLQITQALEEAHEKGIVHRDLKPQNIKASREGIVKVLDFGLAKAMEISPAATPSAAQLAQSPTLTFGATQMGMILGTAAYMSPEQAAGKLVDRRTDIWAFGVVLWEMLSGRRLFDAESVPETLGAVFRQPIDFDALPATTPPAVRRLVERCLERDPKARLRDIGEARIVLSDAKSSSGASAASPGATKALRGAERTANRAGVSRWLPWVVAALPALVSTWIVLRSGTERAAPAPLVAIGVSPPAGHVLAAGEAPVLDIARDGRAVAFEAEGPNGRQLFLRRLDRAEVVPIPGTQGATQPFFSPDGRALGFYANGRIRRVPVAGGGAVADVVGVNAYRGAVWAEGGWIVYTQTYSSGLFKVRESGGGAEPLTTLDAAKSERTHRWPAAIPGSPWVLFSIGVSNSPNFYDDARIGAVNLETGERRAVYEGAWIARFAPPATLLVQRRASLLALPFDPASAELRGKGQVLLDNSGGEASSGAGYFAAGAGGTLAYVPAEALTAETAVVVVDPSGTFERLPLPERRYFYPRFSPDGRSLALDIGSGQGGDDEIWVYDFATKGLSRMTFAGGSALPVWSPDGRSLAYTGGSPSARVNTTFRKRLDGSEDEVPVWKATDITSATDWTRDGRALIATDLRRAAAIGLFLVPLDGSQVVQLVAAPRGQYSGALDPSGRYLAYTSVETGVDEIFVSTFPESRGKWQVSTDGGQLPVWTRDGRKILYVRGDAILAVDVDTADAFRAGTARELRRGPYLLRTAPWRNFDVGPGDRLVFVSRRTDVAAPRQLEVLVGWQRLLETPSRP